MTGEVRVDGREPDGYVHFWTTGSIVTGEFHCSECSYGVTIHRELPRCPMCGGTSWEQTAWSPLTRSMRARLDD